MFGYIITRTQGHTRVVSRESYQHFTNFFFRTKAQEEPGFELTKPSTGQDYKLETNTRKRKNDKIQRRWTTAHKPHTHPAKGSNKETRSSGMCRSSIAYKSPGRRRMSAQEQHYGRRGRARRRQITSGPGLPCPPSSTVKEDPCLLAWLEGAEPLTV